MVLLAVTPVTAFTERSFSMTKRTMRAERSSLKEASASKLSFLKVNARSIKKRRVNQKKWSKSTRYLMKIQVSKKKMKKKMKAKIMIMLNSMKLIEFDQ